MEFRVLGPLEVLDDGVALALGGPRQRLVLASLILDANRVVPTERLIDRIWGDEPPDAVRASLFAYISRLRKLLGSDRIQARPPGYILLAEPNEIDLVRFTDLVDQARSQTDREAADELLSQALELWRGEALSDLTEYDALRPAIARLEEHRLGALETRIEADLDLGRHREALPALESLTTENPLRERLWSLLILALYRSGRQGDALGTYHRARRMLAEELGIDPSPDLQRLHEQVLRQDPALDRPTSPAVSADSPASPPDRRRVKTVIGAGAIVLVVAIAAVWWQAQLPKGLPGSRWTIGLDMPLSGEAAAQGEPVRDAVQMAVDDLNAAGGLEGATLDLAIRDDARDPDRAATNAEAFVADPLTVAMVGPWHSTAAFSVVPLTNEGGLLECSPASTHPGLTKPRFGALDLRAAHPDAINFVRLAPADDIQALALASFAYRDLHARRALVIDDTGVGRDIADGFEVEFKKLGGDTIRLALNPGADPMTVLAPLTDEGTAPDMVFFGGEPDTGAVGLRRAMVDAGLRTIPLLSWDALLNGSGEDSGSYILRAGRDAAVGSYVAHASLPDQKSSFAEAYRDRFGSQPDEYAAAGYACVEIIVASMRAVAAQGPAVDEVRELVRAYASDPEHRYETVLGTIGFDANGDAIQQFVTFYRVEASAASGAGDWVIFKKQDFGPAP